jgi:hypothetical protein
MFGVYNVNKSTFGALDTDEPTEEVIKFALCGLYEGFLTFLAEGFESVVIVTLTDVTQSNTPK